MPNSGNINSTLGSRVRALRKALGLTQVQLSTAVGIKQPSLVAIEKDETKAANIKAETIRKMSKALRTNPNFLLTGRDSPVEPQSLSVEEKEIIDIYRQIGPRTQEAVLSYLRSVLDETIGARRTVARPFPKHPSRTPT